MKNNWNLSEKTCRSWGEDEIMFRFEDVKEFIRLLKEEFKRNWDFEFKDSPLKQLTSHDEMCFEKCDCSKIICDFVDLLAGDKLK